MEETNDNGLPKKKVKTILIIGVCPLIGSVAQRTIQELEKNGDKVVVADSIENVKEGDVDAETLAQLKKQKTDPFGPEPMKITRIDDGLPPLKQFHHFETHNPWPSPKVRKGKRRW